MKEIAESGSRARHRLLFPKIFKIEVLFLWGFLQNLVNLFVDFHGGNQSSKRSLQAFEETAVLEFLNNLWELGTE
jgi:hypothetical protein